MFWHVRTAALIQQSAEILSESRREFHFVDQVGSMAREGRFMTARRTSPAVRQKSGSVYDTKGQDPPNNLRFDGQKIKL